MTPPRWMTLWALAAAILAPTAQATAQDDQGALIDPEADAPAPAPEEGTPTAPISLSLRADASYAFRADLEDADASVARFLAGGGFTLGWQASKSLAFDFSADYEYADYDFEGGSNIIPGLGNDPFDNFNTFSFGVSGTYLFSKQWFATLGGFANAGWESGADVADAWSGGGYVTVGLNVSDRLAIGAGVGASSQLEADPIVFPAIFVRWQIADQLRLESRRLGLRFTYTPVDELDLYIRANWERREYRLADDHAAISDGILRDTTIPVGVGLTWRPLRGLSLGVEGGALVYSKLKFRNDRGNTSFDSELDPGAYVKVFLEYSF